MNLSEDKKQKEEIEVKFCLTKETKVFAGISLFRIQAKKDFSNVKKGDFGGWVEREENLDQSGNAWIYDEAQVFNNGRISGNGRAYDEAQIFDDALIFGNGRALNKTRIFGRARIFGDARALDEAQIFGHAQVSGDTWVGGKARVKKSPLLIQGTKHTFTVVAGIIKIGCEQHSVKYWMENFREIGEKNKYTENEISEYHDYIILAKKQMEEGRDEKI